MGSVTPDHLLSYQHNRRTEANFVGLFYILQNKMFIYFLKIYAHVCVKQNLGFAYSKFQVGDCELPVFVFFFFLGGRRRMGKIDPMFRIS